MIISNNALNSKFSAPVSASTTASSLSIFPCNSLTASSVYARLPAYSIISSTSRFCSMLIDPWRRLCVNRLRSTPR